MGNPRHQPDDDRAAALDARDWIVRLSAGNVSSADLEKFHAWRDQSPAHAQAFAREQQFWQLMQGVDAGAPSTVAKVAPAQPRFSRRQLLVGGAIAASAAALAAPKVLAWLRSDYSTGAGEQLTAALPDGSSLLLNTSTRVALDFAPGRRLVHLMGGEAEFSIKPLPGVPFQVAALGGLSVADAGSLTVRALDDEAMVTTSTAVARVEGAGQAVGLSPGEQTRYWPGGAPQAPVRVDVDSTLAWRNGRVVFNGAPFSEAVRELGRYVAEPVVLASRDRNAQPVSGTFMTRDARDAIEALADTQGLRMRRIPGVVILIS